MYVLPGADVNIRDYSGRLAKQYLPENAPATIRRMFMVLRSFDFWAKLDVECGLEICYTHQVKN